VPFAEHPVGLSGDRTRRRVILQRAFRISDWDTALLTIMNSADPRDGRTEPALVSVVLSFRNEAENIPTLVSRLDAMFAGEAVPYELLFVNDASTDDSLGILIKERDRNPRVKILNLSRRFGVAEGVLGAWRPRPATRSCIWMPICRTRRKWCPR